MRETKEDHPLREIEEAQVNGGNLTEFATCSEHFSEDELKCSHTGIVKMNPEFLDILEKVRISFGKPMKISSAYRDPSHPTEARKGGREVLGDHCRGVAVDVLIGGADAIELIKIAIESGIDRIGVSQKGSWESRFIHLGLSDLDAGKGPAIWSY